jgi:hypothetical protein
VRKINREQHLSAYSGVRKATLYFAYKNQPCQIPLPAGLRCFFSSITHLRPCDIRDSVHDLLFALIRMDRAGHKPSPVNHSWECDKTSLA